MAGFANTINVNTLYGTDTNCATDLPLIDSQVAGITLISNAIIRRITTPNTALSIIGDDPHYGIDVNGLLNDSFTPAFQSSWQSAISQEVIKDERIQDCSCSLIFNQPLSTVTINLNITLLTGPTFSLVVQVSAAGTILFKSNL